MKTIFFRSVLIIGTTLALLSFDKPSGWFNAGSKPQSYEMGIDKGVGQSGKNAATIKSKDLKIQLHKVVQQILTLKNKVPSA